MSDLKKRQRDYYSGKKKRHTLKTQVVVNKLTTEIVCICIREGKTHDFRIFKESGTMVNPEVLIAVDSGYQGLQKMHSNTELPKKRSKKNPLSDADKKKNREIYPNGLKN